MSKVDMLRVLVTERLTAAADEIFGLFERTFADYEDELRRSKRDNECQRKLLDAFLKPEVRLHRVVLSAGVQQPPHIKEEQEQCWSSQEEERLHVKSEDDEAQSSQLHQMQEENGEAEPPASGSAQQRDTESDGEHRGGPEPTGSLDPESYSQPANDEGTLESSEQVDTVKSKQTQKGVSVSQPAGDDGTSDSCEPETEDSDGDWEETRKRQSDLKTLTNSGVAEGDKERNTSKKKSLSCSKCGETFKPNRKGAPGMEPWTCPVCVQKSTQSSQLITKKRTHSGENVFRCSICKKQFSYKGDAVRHVRIHTGEKPFSCSVCSKRFTQSTGLSSHMRTHTGEKPFSCSLCPKRFIRRGVLDRHMRVHTGEKPYSCSECNASFSLSQSLLKHMRIHTGEKPFSCSVCDKTFTQKGHLTQHTTLHTGEKSFSCRVCGRKFTRQSRVNNHKCASKSSSSRK
ncbi:gastrula zinc finger protein XlCGF57.1-like [Cebidichthys violaceus]|uniref:gastrula zinc finger protein XlCGF57.1-like n=1 Tax=Cebidichthys violaceus TaxID=271503 RepID=UPI0035CB41B6